MKFLAKFMFILTITATQFLSITQEKLLSVTGYIWDIIINNENFLNQSTKPSSTEIILFKQQFDKAISLYLNENEEEDYLLLNDKYSVFINHLSKQIMKLVSFLNICGHFQSKTSYVSIIEQSMLIKTVNEIFKYSESNEFDGLAKVQLDMSKFSCSKFKEMVSKNLKDESDISKSNVNGESKIINDNSNVNLSDELKLKNGKRYLNDDKVLENNENNVNFISKKQISSKKALPNLNSLNQSLSEKIITDEIEIKSKSTLNTPKTEINILKTDKPISLEDSLLSTKQSLNKISKIENGYNLVNTHSNVNKNKLINNNSINNIPTKKISDEKLNNNNVINDSNLPINDPIKKIVKETNPFRMNIDEKLNNNNVINDSNLLINDLIKKNVKETNPFRMNIDEKLNNNVINDSNLPINDPIKKNVKETNPFRMNTDVNNFQDNNSNKTISDEELNDIFNRHGNVIVDLQDGTILKKIPAEQYYNNESFFNLGNSFSYNKKPKFKTLSEFLAYTYGTKQKKSTPANNFGVIRDELPNNHKNISASNSFEVFLGDLPSEDENKKLDSKSSHHDFRKNLSQESNVGVVIEELPNKNIIEIEKRDISKHQDNINELNNSTKINQRINRKVNQIPSDTLTTENIEIKKVSNKKKENPNKNFLEIEKREISKNNSNETLNFFLNESMLSEKDFYETLKNTNNSIFLNEILQNNSAKTIGFNSTTLTFLNDEIVTTPLNSNDGLQSENSTPNLLQPNNIPEDENTPLSEFNDIFLPTEQINLLNNTPDNLNKPISIVPCQSGNTTSNCLNLNQQPNVLLIVFSVLILLGFFAIGAKLFRLFKKGRTVTSERCEVENADGDVEIIEMPNNSKASAPPSEIVESYKKINVDEEIAVIEINNVTVADVADK